jgi:hypothetical protein
VVLVGGLSFSMGFSLGGVFSLFEGFSDGLGVGVVLVDFDGEVPLAGGVLAGGVELGGLGVLP